MAKPSSLPRWAETAGGAAASNIVEPNSGKKDTGYITGGDIPASGGLNWFMRLIYKWAQWTDAFANADGTLDFSQLGAVAAKIKGAMADGASAVGTILDTAIALTTSGAKLLSLRNNGTEKAYFDKDGGATFSGPVSVATATAAAHAVRKDQSETYADTASTEAPSWTTLAGYGQGWSNGSPVCQYWKSAKNGIVRFRGEVFRAAHQSGDSQVGPTMPSGSRPAVATTMVLPVAATSGGYGGSVTFVTIDTDGVLHISSQSGSDQYFQLAGLSYPTT
jgi:hypothetical protein